MAQIQIQTTPLIVQRRGMLAYCDLADAWTASGPTFSALVWLSCEHRPAELTEDQWDVLLLAWATWDAAGLAPRPQVHSRRLAGSIARRAVSTLVQAPACAVGR